MADKGWSPYDFDRTPTLEELKEHQGTEPITDWSTVPRDPEPDADSVEDFIRMLRELRGHTRDDEAA